MLEMSRSVEFIDYLARMTTTMNSLLRPVSKDLALFDPLLSNMVRSRLPIPHNRLTPTMASLLRISDPSKQLFRLTRLSCLFDKSLANSRAFLLRVAWNFDAG